VIDNDFMGRLSGQLDAAPPHALVDVVRVALEAEAGAKTAAVLLSDYADATLERLEGGGATASSASLPVDGSAEGRAYRRQAVTVVDDDRGHRVLVPVTVRSERLGLLEVVLPSPPDDATLDVLRQLGGIVAYVIITARRYTDLFERVRRRRSLELGAEIQWELLPVLAYEGSAFALAGALEPAYSIAGDSFDYAVEADHVTLVITDGMGHGLRAALLGSLALSSLRNARRRGLALAEQAGATNDVLFDQFGGEQFVTALLVRIDLGSGEAEAVDAGHPHALRVRGGRADDVVLAPDPPMGLFQGQSYTVQRFRLEVGDRVALVSDGITEARPPDGDDFGRRRLGRLLLEGRDHPPVEVVRRVTKAVMEHRGTELRDDATILCLDWKGQ
jgi:serine phosphatase RsbU (regulator of sigma subunit)